MTKILYKLPVLRQNKNEGGGTFDVEEEKAKKEGIFIPLFNSSRPHTHWALDLQKVAAKIIPPPF